MQETQVCTCRHPRVLHACIVLQERYSEALAELAGLARRLPSEPSVGVALAKVHKKMGNLTVSERVVAGRRAGPRANGPGVDLGLGARVMILKQAAAHHVKHTPHHALLLHGGTLLHALVGCCLRLCFGSAGSCVWP